MVIPKPPWVKYGDGERGRSSRGAAMQQRKCILTKRHQPLSPHLSPRRCSASRNSCLQSFMWAFGLFLGRMLSVPAKAGRWGGVLCCIAGAGCRVDTHTSRQVLVTELPAESETEGGRRENTLPALSRSTHVLHNTVNVLYSVSNSGTAETSWISLSKTPQVCLSKTPNLGSYATPVTNPHVAQWSLKEHLLWTISHNSLSHLTWTQRATTPLWCICMENFIW